MAPHFRSIDLSHVEDWASATDSMDFFKILLLISLVATAIKSCTVLSLRRKRRSEYERPCQEKEQETTNQPDEEKVSTYFPPEDPNHRLHALRQELEQPAFKPVWPWIAPPTPLPGPYDAPYYPLPGVQSPPLNQTVEKSDDFSTSPYIRRISSSSSPNQEATLHGITTVSSQGWRRTQWTVATG